MPNRAPFTYVYPKASDNDSTVPDTTRSAKPSKSSSNSIAYKPTGSVQPPKRKRGRPAKSVATTQLSTPTDQSESKQFEQQPESIQPKRGPARKTRKRSHTPSVSESESGASTETESKASSRAVGEAEKTSLSWSDDDDSADSDMPARVRRSTSKRRRTGKR